MPMAKTVELFVGLSAWLCLPGRVIDSTLVDGRALRRFYPLGHFSYYLHWGLKGTVTAPDGLGFRLQLQPALNYSELADSALVSANMLANSDSECHFPCVKTPRTLLA